MDYTYTMYHTLERPTIEYIHEEHNIISKRTLDSYVELKSRVFLHRPKNPLLVEINHIDQLLNNVRYLFHMCNTKNGLNVIMYPNFTYKIQYIEGPDFFVEVKKPKKFSTLYNTMISHELYLLHVKHIESYYDKEDFLYPYYIKTLILLYDYLEIGGTFYHGFKALCKSRQIELLYLLSFMFKEVVITNKGVVIACKEFLGEQYVSKSTLKKIFKNPFTIQNKVKHQELLEYVDNIYDTSISIFKSYLKEDVNEYIRWMGCYILKKAIFFQIPDETLSEPKKDIYHLIGMIIDHCKIEKHVMKFNDDMSSSLSTLVSNLVHDFKYRHCLEIGCNYGLSSIYLLTSHKDINLVSIDPYQSTHWGNYGMNLVKQLKLNSRHKCIKQSSIKVLPELLEKENKYDIIYINGCRAFDYTVVDMFYATRLLNDGGVIIFDDILCLGIDKCIRYISTNYSNFVKMKSPNDLVCFKKIDLDKRAYNFHAKF